MPGDPTANPMVALGPGRHRLRRRARHPRRRAPAGTTPTRRRCATRAASTWAAAAADPSQLTDVEDPTLANVMLTNGARLYVDHAHPEYSSPEVTTPRDAVIWDRAGELVMLEAVRRALRAPGLPGGQPLQEQHRQQGRLLRHPRELPDARARRRSPTSCAHLTPFFVVRQVDLRRRAGSGIGVRTAAAPATRSAQRADFFEVEVGLETTLKRPIINTRDEPHAVADRYRRLHVIIGDANHCEVANLLKVGTTSLVLGDDRGPAPHATTCRSTARSRALHAVSHDPTLQATVELRRRPPVTALELQWMYLEPAARYVDDRVGGDADARHRRGHALLGVRARHGSARDPMECARELDWVAKLRLLEGYRERDGLGWDDPRLQADRPAVGRRAARQGPRTTGSWPPAGSSVLVDEAEVRRAVDEPPDDTRAYFRGRCLRRYPRRRRRRRRWDSVIFDVAGPARRLQRVPMLEPLRGTEAQRRRPARRSAPDAASLLRALAANARPGA